MALIIHLVIKAKLLEIERHVSPTEQFEKRLMKTGVQLPGPVSMSQPSFFSLNDTKEFRHFQENIFNGVGHSSF